MEMCYDGALVMPSSYAVMDENEMTYTEGGGSKTYRKGDKSGYIDLLGAATTLGYLAGIGYICSLGSKALAATGVGAGVGAVLHGIFKILSVVAGYFAVQAWNAAQVAKSVYKKRQYSVVVSTFFGVPTSIFVD